MGQSMSSPSPSPSVLSNRRDRSLSRRFFSVSIEASTSPILFEDDDEPETTSFRYDYTSEIPDECLACIFQSLPSVDRKQCSLVCQRWFVVEGQSRHRLSLNASNEIVPDLPTIFTRFDSVTKLSLRCDRRSVSIGDEALELISLRCRNLKRLKLRGCRELTDAGVQVFAKNCSGLKKLSCGTCMFGAKGLNAILDYCAGLEEISIKRLSSLKNGRGQLELIGPGAAAGSLKIISLKELHNGQCFAPLVIGSKKLKTLKVFRCLGEWDRLFETISDKNSSLTEVHLERLQVSDFGLAALSNCSNLEILHIVKTPECTSTQVISGFPQIYFLSHEISPRVFPSPWFTIESFPFTMKILVWNCRGIGNASAVRSTRELVKEQRPHLLCLIETKCVSKKWDYLRVSLGFQNCISVGSKGRGSGGLAILWADELSVTLENYSQFHIDVRIDCSPPFRLTLFYGHPESHLRKNSWNLLERLAGLNTQPWIAVGDFNEVCYNSEVFSSSLRNSSRMRDFRQCLSRCGLEDLGYRGSQFTYSNKRKAPLECKARLDRAVATSSWRSLFPGTEVHHLIAGKSDHRPIVIAFAEDVIPHKAERRFKFESMWYRHGEFHNVVGNLWSRINDQNASLSNSLKGLGRELSFWNQNVFGHAGKKIRELKERLSVLWNDQRTEATCMEESVVTKNLDEWLEREEIMWRQRSRVQWIHEGDRNTRFFHAKASQRRITNKIMFLKNDAGDYISLYNEIMLEVTNYFHALFKTSLSGRAINWDEALSDIIPSISTDQNLMLESAISIDEVKASLFAMNPSKSPGPDGFPAQFFQKEWTRVKDKLLKEILALFEEGQIDQSWNDTTITLIPKKKGADRLRDFRPISLCNVSMKVATKLFANRLKRCLPNLISQNQSAFIEGRMITDNIIIAHEIMHSIKQRRGTGPGLISLKIDINKAYDKVEWIFIQKMMEKMGFSAKFIDRIMIGVRSVRYKVVVNGSLSESITPERGIRQGDPISPYLFLICAEWLSKTLSGLLRSNSIQGIKISRQSPNVSHLLFADDCLIFFRAVKEEALAIKEALDRFEHFSGLGINCSKSAFVCSPNTSPESCKDIEDILGIRRVENFGKYLGLPISAGSNKQVLFREVEDRLDFRLSDWKLKLLSRAGKDTLLKSVALSIPIYAMQVYKMPKVVTDRMGKHMIAFFWNKSGNTRSTHWVKKDILLADKAAGGLGLRDLSSFNDALLLKQLWRILSKPESLVAVLIKSKYFPTTSLADASEGYRPSLFWRSMMKVKNFLQIGVQGLNDMGEVRWNNDSSGLYSVKSGYSFIVENRAAASGREGECSNRILSGTFWRKLWTIKLPPRIKLHSWRAFHGGLPDGEVLERRCGIIPGACGWCGWKKDSILHIVRECWAGKLLGSFFDINVELYDLNGGSMADWMFRCSLSLSPEAFRSMICISWVLWNSRNDFVHSGRLWRMDEMVPKVRTVLGRVDSIGLDRLRWQTDLSPSGPGAAQVCCDGSWIWNTAIGQGEAGWGAVVMIDEVVTALNAGFLEDITSSDMAEGTALWKGLTLGDALNLDEASFMTDSVAVLRLLALGSGLTLQPHWLRPCLQLLHSRPRWKVGWIPRERNSVADFVSKKARRYRWSWSRTDALPGDIFHVLTSGSRLCLVSIKKKECTSTGLVSVAQGCKLLRKLHIDGWRTNRIGDEGLIAVAKNCPNLQELVLIGVNPTHLSLTALANNCRNLERLALCGSDSIRDEEIVCISEKCLALRKLCIKGCPISDHGMKSLAWGFPNLVKIKVKKCRGVTSDIAGWLQDNRRSLIVILDGQNDAAEVIVHENDSDTPQLLLPGSNEATINADAPSSSTGRSTPLRSKFSLFNFVACTFRRWTSDNTTSNSIRKQEQM